MSDLKERRQRAIVDLIRGSALANQDELAERLSGLGFAVTQATISRDLEQLGAVKVRRDGELTYALK
jgi:transcriptional regulator of arginine metabolism